MTSPAPRQVPSGTMPTSLLVGIFLILLTAALKLGAGLLLPIAIAGPVHAAARSAGAGARAGSGLPTAVGGRRWWSSAPSAWW